MSWLLCFDCVLTVVRLCNFLVILTRSFVSVRFIVALLLFSFACVRACVCQRISQGEHTIDVCSPSFCSTVNSSSSDIKPSRLLSNIQNTSCSSCSGSTVSLLEKIFSNSSKSIVPDSEIHKFAYFARDKITYFARDKITYFARDKKDS